MDEEGKEIDTSLALYALLTAASFGYMHCDFHGSNIIIDNNVKPNTVFQCSDDTNLNPTQNQEYNKRMTMTGQGNMSSHMSSQRVKFANKRVLTIDWGRYNKLSIPDKQKINSYIDSIKDAININTLKKSFFLIIQFFQVQMLKYKNPEAWS